MKFLFIYLLFYPYLTLDILLTEFKFYQDAMNYLLKTNKSNSLLRNRVFSHAIKLNIDVKIN